MRVKNIQALVDGQTTRIRADVDGKPLWFKSADVSLRPAAEVHTDRLHCMLLAVLLGKPTFAYPTTYRKLEAVYEHSVKDWAHVEFVRDTRRTST